MKIRIPLILGGVLFLIFYLLTALWHPLTPDDYHFLFNVKTHGGHLNATIWEYNNWSTRFTSVFFNHWMLSFSNLKMMIVLRDMLTLSMLFLVVRKGLMKWGVNNYKIELTLLFSVIFFWCIIDIGSTWFWHCAVFTYTWTCIALANALMNQSEKVSWKSYLMVVVCYFYLGGASAPVALIAFLIQVVLLGLGIKKRINWDKRLLIVGVLSLLASFLILMLGQGNEVRASQLPDVSIIEAVWINCKSVLKFYLFLVPTKLLYWIAGGLFAGILVSKFKKSFFRGYEKWLLLSLPVVTFIYHLPIAYVMGEIGPDRTFGFISFYHQLVFIIIGVNTGFRIKSNEYGIWFYPIAIVVLICIYLPVHFSYNEAMENRVEFIQSNLEGDVYLEKLPNSGLYKNGEITDDSEHFLNNHLKKSFGVKGDVLLNSK